MRLAAKVRSLVVVLVLVSAGSFFLTNLLPGSPAVTILGPAATPESIAELERDLHLDDPVPVRYVRWITSAVRGDLGTSYRTGEPAADLLRSAASVTIELVVLAEVLALLLGIPLALWAAARAERVADRAVSVFAIATLAAPQFAVATVLLLVFAVRLQWLPAIGYVSPADGLGENLRAMLLPAITMGLPLAAQYVRVLRADLTIVLQQEHLRLAQAMGLPRRRILVRHALRQSSLTLVTVMGLQLGGLLGGSLVVESIFALPGVGRLMVGRITTRDYPVVQAGVLLIATVGVLANFAADVLHGVLDPRIRRAAPAGGRAAETAGAAGRDRKGP